MGNRTVLTHGISRAGVDSPRRYWTAQLMRMTHAYYVAALSLCWTNSRTRGLRSLKPTPVPHVGRHRQGDRDAPRTPSVPGTQDGERVVDSGRGAPAMEIGQTRLLLSPQNNPHDGGSPSKLVFRESGPCPEIAENVDGESLAL